MRKRKFRNFVLGSIKSREEEVNLCRITEKLVKQQQMGKFEERTLSWAFYWHHQFSTNLIFLGSLQLFWCGLRPDCGLQKNLDWHFGALPTHPCICQSYFDGNPFDTGIWTTPESWRTCHPRRRSPPLRSHIRWYLHRKGSKRENIFYGFPLRRQKSAKKVIIYRNIECQSIGILDDTGTLLPSR